MRDDDEQYVPMRWMHPEAKAERFANTRKGLVLAAGLSAIPRTPSVYVLMSHDGTMVKIGKSMKPRTRIKDIRAMNPHPVTVLLTIPGYTRLESWFHATFSAQRSHGEWFWYDGPLAETLAMLMNGATLESLRMYAHLEQAADLRELSNTR